MRKQHYFFTKSSLVLILFLTVTIACKKSNQFINSSAALIAKGNSTILPAALADAIPSTDTLAFSLAANGYQIYTATKSGAAFVWSTSTPQANLWNEADEKVGTHFGGPTWKIGSTDSIVGVKMVGVVLDPNNVPWLVLKPSATLPTGKFALINRIARILTEGGIEPANKPSQADVDNKLQISVPYSALYKFYKPK